MEQIKNEHTRLFGQLIRKHDSALSKICNKYGIYKGQQHILKALEETPGLTQNELAKKINVAKASITTSLNRMEKNGFVVRKKCKHDGRCNQIYITEKGIEANHGCSKEINELKKALFSKINDDELNEVNILLSKMIEGLNSLEEDK